MLLVLRLQIFLWRNRRIEGWLIELLKLRYRHRIDFLTAERAHESLAFIQCQGLEILPGVDDMWGQKYQQVVPG